MKCCYKIINSEGNLVGVEGVYEELVEDRFDTDFNEWYIAITYEEYLECCEELGIDSR